MEVSNTMVNYHGN